MDRFQAHKAISGGMSPNLGLMLKSICLSAQDLMSLELMQSGPAAFLVLIFLNLFLSWTAENLELG